MGSKNSDQSFSYIFLAACLILIEIFSGVCLKNGGYVDIFKIIIWVLLLQIFNSYC